jgi:transcriptional regulator with XRE-family HTH domain
VRTSNYPHISSQNAEARARFAQQMADYARGQRLVQLREGRHLSQEDAAHEIGVSAKSLRAWEHGGPIRWDNAKRVARFYKVKAEELVSRELPEPVDFEEVYADQLTRIEEMLKEVLRRLPTEREVAAPSVPGPRIPKPKPRPAKRSDIPKKRRATG